MRDTQLRSDGYDDNDPFILVEGPGWSDAKFLGQWLLAAAEADDLWKEAIKDSTFRRDVTRLQFVELGLDAIELVKYLLTQTVSFMLYVHDEMVGDTFAVLAEMGFFALTGDRYQMVLPRRLDLSTLKRAVLRLAGTEDSHEELNPQLYISTMPCAQAKQWQKRLRRMDEDQRIADRLLLLEEQER